MKQPKLSFVDTRSWHLNEAALARAACDWPAASKVIARNLDRLEQEKRAAPAYLARCRELFEMGPEAMQDAFLALTEEAQVLRSIHPFAGLLNEEERAAILKRTQRRGE